MLVVSLINKLCAFSTRKTLFCWKKRQNYSCILFLAQNLYGCSAIKLPTVIFIRQPSMYRKSYTLNAKNFERQYIFGH